MHVNAVTVGIPARNLQEAIAWYQNAFELNEPDLIPIDGVVEFNLGPFWLQIFAAPERAGSDGVSVNLSVADASAERRRLADIGAAVTEIERCEGVVEFFRLTDLDGNNIGFVTELN